MLCFFTTLVIGYLPPLDNVLRVDPSLPVLAGSNREDDLADLPARFEITRTSPALIGQVSRLIREQLAQPMAPLRQSARV